MMRQAVEESPGKALSLINPKGLCDPSANGYSHVAAIAAGARLVYVAGQGGETESGALAPDFRLQVRQALGNLGIALAAAGARAADIAKLTVLIVDHSEQRLHVFGEELTRALGEGRKPACTLIPAPRLALDGMLFEVEAVAALRA
ncbi:MAG TPA: RidA family protein [Dongiaceae bacterium]|jgi:enamine deaminase RidA (YjgF/YER057c/UK114 family)|nr:RidA family protein [Dongiaceae bacterium]